MSENSGKTRTFGIAEIAGTALIVPAILVLFALVSYEEATGAGASANMIGVGGHVVAELLLYLFGMAAYVLPPYLLGVGAYCLARGQVPDLLLRAIALFILVIATAVLIYLSRGMDETLFWSGGGVMGRRLGDALETIVGRYGAFILAGGALLPGVMIGSPYSLPDLARRLSEGTGQGLRTSGSIFWKIGTIAVGLSVAAGVLKALASGRKHSEEQEPPDRNRAGKPAEHQTDDHTTEQSYDDSSRAATARHAARQKEHERMKPSTQNSPRAHRAPVAEQTPATTEFESRLPFFGKIEADRKPWFERQGSLSAQEAAVEPRSGRGHLEKISPTYGRQVALDNAFLLSTRARHVRDMLSGLGGQETGRDREGQESSAGGDAPAPVPAPRPSASLRGFPRGTNRRTAAATESSLKREGGLRGKEAYDGFFTEDDSRFHFRSLDLDRGRPQARGIEASERPESAPDVDVPRERAAATAVRPSRQPESLLRPINLKILEREQPRRSEPESMPDAVTMQEQGKAIRMRAGADVAIVDDMAGDDAMQALEEATDGALALDRLPESERVESAPTRVQPIETIPEDPSLLDEVAEDGAPLEPDFLENEAAVEAALQTAGFENESALRDAAEYEDAGTTSAEEEGQPRPEERARLVRENAPSFPDLPAVEVLRPDYYIPRDILRMPKRLPPEDVKGEIEITKQRLEKVMHDFGIKAEIVRTQRGPIITLYEIRPEAGIKVSKIMGIVDEIKMNLEARSVRIIAPIPGKNTVGIEIPNRRREEVTLGELVRHDPSFFGKSRELSLAMGKDISGENGYVDLTRLPHLLIAGATGAGKSVYMNSIIASLLYTRSPHELRFIMIDPKMVELTLFEGIPHLLMPVITDVKRASKALNWAVNEMERRYAFLSHMKCRDIRSYNSKFAKPGVSSTDTQMPYLVIFIDELSDLMIMAPKDVEDSIIRLTQKARAVGIHIVMATQRPSVDVITALIKANCPARIAFQVAQKTDSRVILDHNGAETLLGRGDMLYRTPTATGLGRIQTPLIEESEIEKIVEETRRYGRPSYIDLPGAGEGEEEFASEGDDVDREHFEEAWRIVQETGKTSTSYVQRRLRIGYNRAARIIEMMEEKGYLGPQIGNRPREILKKD